MTTRAPRLTTAGRSVTVASIGLLIMGVVADYPELVSLALCGLAALAVAAAWTASRPAIRANRFLASNRVPEGGSAECTLEVSNGGRRASLPMEVIETLLAAPIQLPRIAPGGRHEVGPYELPLRRRGVYRIPPPFVGRSDPLRLMRGGSAAGPDTTVYVHPKVYPMGIPGVPRSEAEAAAPQGALRSVVSFHSLREYRPGDDCRLIHWMSTARLGDLVVRQHVAPDQPGHLVVLDTSEGRYTVESFEEAVRAAASVSVAVARRDLPVELRTSTGQYVPDRRRHGRRPAEAILDHLAGARPTPDRPELAQWLAAIPRPRRTTVLTVVTGRLAPRELAAMANETHRWASTTVVAVDPHEARLFTTQRGLRLTRVSTCAELVVQVGRR